ncbi:MAG: 30S ribosomal protein S17 [Turneriella sp.]|nr:30S ribosomal protein S17 [Leptospiraceae bacterium]MCX7633432.1 30S ribosomal protein S17 [Turneriella sp.]
MSVSTGKTKKTLQGVVISAKTPKTIVVRVEFRKPDPRFKKTVIRSKKVMAHDEKGEAREGDTVVVVESRPYSRRKRYLLQKIVARRSEPLPALPEEQEAAHAANAVVA